MRQDLLCSAAFLACARTHSLTTRLPRAECRPTNSVWMSCLQVLPKGPSENGAAMQVDEAEECFMRGVLDFEQELKQRCVALLGSGSFRLQPCAVMPLHAVHCCTLRVLCQLHSSQK